jgi:Uri superfamily endonuclease
LQTDQLNGVMKPEPGTYALILQSHTTARVQIGRWREIDVEPGYYIHIGSAFWPGGVRARISRHCRTDKPKHWHIDYLREFVIPIGVWVSYEPERLEHRWAQAFYDMRETMVSRPTNRLQSPLCDLSSGWGFSACC